MKPTLYKHNGVWKLACRLVPMRGSTLTHPFKKDYQDRELALKDLANLYKAEQVYRGPKGL